jgi:hypothetical protein
MSLLDRRHYRGPIGRVHHFFPRSVCSVKNTRSQPE